MTLKSEIDASSNAVATGSSRPKYIRLILRGLNLIRQTNRVATAPTFNDLFELNRSRLQRIEQMFGKVCKKFRGAKKFEELGKRVKTMAEKEGKEHYERLLSSIDQHKSW